MLTLQCFLLMFAETCNSTPFLQDFVARRVQNMFFSRFCWHYNGFSKFFEDMRPNRDLGSGPRLIFLNWQRGISFQKWTSWALCTQDTILVFLDLATFLKIPEPILISTIELEENANTILVLFSFGFDFGLFENETVRS